MFLFQTAGPVRQNLWNLSGVPDFSKKTTEIVAKPVLFLLIYHGIQSLFMGHMV